MAKRFYGKKRSSKSTRRSRGRRASTKRVSFAVKSYVKKTISRNLEDKIWMHYGNNQTINLVAPSHGDPPLIKNLLPVLTQGTASGERIGNKIKIKNAYIKGMVSLKAYGGVPNPHVAPIYVKMWIISNRICNDWNLDLQAPLTPTYDKFFQDVNTSMPFQGLLTDILKEVNTEVWTVHKSKVFYLGSTSNSTAVPSATARYDNSKFSQMFYFNYTKYCKNLVYNDNGSVATNQNLYLIAQAVYADGSSDGYQIGNLHYTTFVHYEDA